MANDTSNAQYIRSGITDAPPILHVFVVGFHHKRGCQVRYRFFVVRPQIIICISIV